MYLILCNGIRASIWSPISVNLPRSESAIVHEAQDVLLVQGVELQVSMLRDLGHYNETITIQWGGVNFDQFLGAVRTGKLVKILLLAFSDVLFFLKNLFFSYFL